MDLGLDGKVALVTGAGSGIGAAIATALADEGCIVHFGDTDLRAATRSAAQGANPGRALQLDVGDASSLQENAERIAAEHGTIDILVNNAGILKTGSFIESTIADWDEVCRVNLSGVYYCCKAVVPFMVRRKSGKIVNIASVAAAKGGGVFGNVLYGTSKAGVVALTQGMARELGPHGINVNCIAPAVTETGMTRALLTPERKETALKSIPLGRFATPKDIANMALILASDVSSYVTGETIVVDGGYLTR